MEIKNLPNPPFMPLDFVRPVGSEKIGMVKEISHGVYTSPDGPIIRYKASVTWIGDCEGLKTAWWLDDEIILVDSLPRILLKDMAHPFGDGAKMADKCYPITR